MAHPDRAFWSVLDIQSLHDIASTEAGRRLVRSVTPEDYIGNGHEKEVFSYGDEKVIAFFPRLLRKGFSPETIGSILKSYYYAGKLAHLLLPENIPQVHLASSQPPILIMDRIYSRGEVISLDERHAFRLKMAAIGLDRAVDLSEGNLLRDSEGNLVYVDIVSPEMLINNEQLDTYIDSLAPAVKAKARRLQHRLVLNIDD